MASNSLVNAQNIISNGFEVAIRSFFIFEKSLKNLRKIVEKSSENLRKNKVVHLPGGIIGGGDEALIFGTVGNGFEGIGDLIESLDDISQDVDGGGQFRQGVLGFHGGGDDGDVDALGADGVIERDAGDVDI